MQIDYLVCAACLTKPDSFIGLDFMNLKGQTVFLFFKLRAALSNHGLMVGGRDKNQFLAVLASELCSVNFVAKVVGVRW